MAKLNLGLGGSSSVYGAQNEEDVSGLGEFALDQTLKSLSSMDDNRIINGKSVAQWRAIAQAEKQKRLPKVSEQAQSLAAERDSFYAKKTDPWGDYMKSWEDPYDPNVQPFYTGPANNPVENLLGSGGNMLLQSPQRMTKTIGDYVINPLLGAGKTAGQFADNTIDWMSKPEGISAAEQAAADPPVTKLELGPLPQVGSTAQRIIGAESGGDPAAKNSRSSALGRGQFLDGTWLEFMKDRHPEVLERNGPAAALNMRTNPNLSDEATQWYRDQGADFLGGLGIEINDRNLYAYHHFGPGGSLKLLQSDPSASAESVLGRKVIEANPQYAGKTVGDVLSILNVKMGGMPRVPDPVRPDYSEQDRWLAQAAPTPADPAALARMQMSMWLAGIGSGLGSVNASQEGVGRLLGAMAGGGSRGMAEGERLGFEASQGYKESQQAYAGGRARIAGDRAGTDLQLRQQQQEADQANMLIDNAPPRQPQPKVLSAGQSGVVMQDPITGEISVMPMPGQEQENSIYKAVTALGGINNPAAGSLKYKMMLDTGAPLPQIKMSIVKDLVDQGQTMLFGDAYAAAAEAADAEIPPAAMTGNNYNEMRNQLIAAKLFAALSQGGDEWLLAAAQAGNPGAALLAQGANISQSPQQVR